MPIELKTTSHASTASARLPTSVTSPRAGSMPAGRTLAARFGSRTSARTWSPLSRRAEAMACPTFPVAPVTRARIGQSYAGSVPPFLAVAVPVRMAVALRTRAIHAPEAGEHLSGKLAAIPGVERRGHDPHDDLIPVELLDGDVRGISQRDVDRLLDRVL